MRAIAMSLALLVGHVTGVRAPAASAPSAAGPPIVAAVSVEAAPPIDPTTRATLSADGTVVAGLVGSFSGQRYRVFDRATGSVLDESAPGAVLTRDGRHLVSATEVRPLGGPATALPPLPVGFTEGTYAAASADGGTVVRYAADLGNLYFTAFVTRPGGDVIDVNGGSVGRHDLRGARDVAISADGRYVSYVHADAAPGCSDGDGSDDCVYEVYRRDLADGSLVAVSRTATGTESRFHEGRTAVSDDGRFVAFLSTATDLAVGTPDVRIRIFRHDVMTGRTVLVAEDIDTDHVDEPYSMSGDGMRFAYRSSTGRDVRIADLAAGTDRPLVRQATTSFPVCSIGHVLSGDGRTVAFRACSPGATVVEPAGAPDLTSVLGLATLPPPRNTVDYVGVTPRRLYDSREGDTDAVPNLAAGSQVAVTVAGRAGLPADAGATVLNVTVTNARAPGFVTVWPCDEARPTASNLNYGRDETIANAVVADVGGDGTVCLFTNAAADLVVDVQGGFGTASSYRGMVPRRVLDTRLDEATSTPPTLAAGSDTSLDVVTAAGLARSTEAVVLNVTVTKAAGPGFVTVHPCGTALPTASNLNYATGQTIPNAVVGTLGVDGTVCLFTSNAVDLIVDVAGTFSTATGFVGLTPARLLDTRDGATVAVPNLVAGSVTTLTVAGRAGVPVGAAAAVLNVTVTNPTAAGFVTVYPCDSDLPTASNLNHVAGQTIPNMVVTELSLAGTVCLFTQAPADLIVDVVGHLGRTPPG